MDIGAMLRGAEASLKSVSGGSRYLRGAEDVGGATLLVRCKRRRLLCGKVGGH